MRYTPIIFPDNTQPMLSVVVHTEERFDWSKGFHRDEINVDHIKYLHVVQTMFDGFGIKPVYVVDYPIASQQSSIKIIKELLLSNRAEIGTHLQPWVSPPHTEELSEFSSFPCNLPETLEYEKILCLTEKIQENFDVRPSCYLAGRYGFGKNTARILKKLEYDIDLSSAPPFDYGQSGGPDFSRTSNYPYWIDPQNSLLAIPGTGAYVGLLNKFGADIHPLIRKPYTKKLYLPSILAKLNFLERIRLSPEGFGISDMKRLTNFLLSQNVKHFTLSFHSPSITPGNTSYVRNKEELTLFLENMRLYFDYFFSEIHGVSTTPMELKNLIITLEKQPI